MTADTIVNVAAIVTVGGSVVLGLLYVAYKLLTGK